MSRSTTATPLARPPHSHLRVRAMPRAFGSDLEAGRLHRTESGSGRVTSRTTALESSISRVSHHAHTCKCAAGPHGAVRNEWCLGPREFVTAVDGKVPACLGAPCPRAHARRVSLMVRSRSWDLVPPLLTNSCVAIATYAMVDLYPAACRIAAPDKMMFVVSANGSGTPEARNNRSQRGSRASRGRKDV